jgi:pimeloyl-ACP methyl ester carboxylesterase
MPESLTPHSSPLTLHSSEAVVLVHGLFRNGWEMAFLRLRLAAVGYRTVQFTYPTVRLSPEKNAKDLQAFIDKKIEAETLHFVALSLGGLVIRYLFHNFSQQRPGRIVTMGTIIIPVSHIGMLLSDEVIYQTRCFLRHGRFDPRTLSWPRD